MGLVNTNAVVRTIITSHAPLTAIIPATRMFADWPATFQTLPVLAYSEQNNSTTSEDYFDSEPLTQRITVQFDVFGPPSTSLFSAVDALNDAMEAQKWNRDSCLQLTEPDTLNRHYVITYSNRLYNP